MRGARIECIILTGWRDRHRGSPPPKRETIMSAENEAWVRRYVEEIYDQRKLEVVDEIFSPDFTLHDPDLPDGEGGPRR